MDRGLTVAPDPMTGQPSLCLDMRGNIISCPPLPFPDPDWFCEEYPWHPSCRPTPSPTPLPDPDWCGVIDPTPPWCGAPSPDPWYRNEIELDQGVIDFLEGSYPGLGFHEMKFLLLATTLVLGLWFSTISRAVAEHSISVSAFDDIAELAKHGVPIKGSVAFHIMEKGNVLFSDTDNNVVTIVYEGNLYVCDPYHLDRYPRGNYGICLLEIHVKSSIRNPTAVLGKVAR